MQSSQSFRRSRRQLAAWYTGVMTLILMAGTYTIYRLIVHARWVHLERDVQQLAIALDRQIQPALTRPGTFSAIAPTTLPGLCLTNQDCNNVSSVEAPLQEQLLQTIPQINDEYCVRFVDLNDQTVATLNIPLDKSVCDRPEVWDPCRTCQRDTYYYYKYYPLQDVAQQDWGTLRIARSLNQLDWYLLYVEITLLGLLLLAVLLVGYASWWLAGMAMRPLQQSYEQMQQFTADASHELRTPVAAIRAMVQAALRSSEDLTPEEITTALQTVDRQSQRLTRLLQDLLVLSTLDQAAKDRSKAVCDLTTLLKDLVEEFQAIARTADVKLVLNFPTAKAIHTLGNPDQLHRAVANLLSNGIQYTPAGGQVTLTLSSESTHHAIIEVADTGVGIAAEAQAKIFDRFYRVEKERSRHSGGSGLGLAIVQAIAQAHNGTVQVTSEPGKGSTFTLRVPMLIVL